MRGGAGDLRALAREPPLPRESPRRPRPSHPPPSPSPYTSPYRTNDAPPSLFQVPSPPNHVSPLRPPRSPVTLVATAAHTRHAGRDRSQVLVDMLSDEIDHVRLAAIAALHALRDKARARPGPTW